MVQVLVFVYRRHYSAGIDLFQERRAVHRQRKERRLYQI